MTAFVALWRLARSLPTLAYAAAGAVAAAGILWAWHGHAVAGAYAAGRADAVAEAVTVATIYKDRVVHLAGRTDTTIKRVTHTITITDTLIRLVPESIRVAVPSVDHALRACTTLAHDCDQLRVDLLGERIARDDLTRSLSMITVAKGDSIRTLSRRPRWRTVGAVALVAATGGYAWGRR